MKLRRTEQMRMVMIAIITGLLLGGCYGGGEKEGWRDKNDSDTKGFPACLEACSDRYCEFDCDDEFEEYPLDGPKVCDIDFVKWAISNDKVAKSFGEDDQSYNANDIVANCSSSKDSAESCQGNYAELMIATLDYLEQVNGVLGLMGGLKRGGMAGQQAGALAAGFVGPMIEALEIMHTKAVVVENLDRCEIVFEKGLPLEMDGLFEMTTTASWGKLEARLIGLFTNFSMTFWKYLMAHDLDAPIDILMGISDTTFSNIPWSFKNVLEPMLLGNTFMSIYDYAKFEEVRTDINNMMREIKKLITNRQEFISRKNGYVIDIEDVNQNNDLDGGDIITFNGMFTLDDGTTEQNMEFIFPDQMTDKTLDNINALAEKMIASLYLQADCSALDISDLSPGCLSLADFNEILKIMGLIDQPLPDVYRANFSQYFDDPARAGIRDFLMTGDEIIVAGEAVSCENDEPEYCDQPYITIGDSSHFSGANEISADGITAEYKEKELVFYFVSGTISSYVVPYLQPNNCDFSGSIWYNPAHLSDYQSTSGIDFGAGEEDRWAHGSGADCSYAYNKLNNFFLQEFGMYGPFKIFADVEQD